MRSIIISEQLLGTQEIILVKHTGCGMLTFQNEDAYGLVEKNLGYWPQQTHAETLPLTIHRNDAAAELKARGLDFLPFPDLEKAVEDDVKYLQDTKLVPNNVPISGWVYEVETGRTRRVV